MQEHFPQKNSSLATRNYNSNFTSFNFTNLDSQHATRVRLTQNELTPARQHSNLKSFLTNHTIFDSDHESRVRFTQNQLTLASQIFIL